MRFQEIQERCWTGYQQQGMKKKGDREVPNCVPVAEVKLGPEITGRDLLFKAAAMAMRDAGREGISMDYEEAIKKAAKIYGIPYTPSELPRLLAQRAEIDRQLAMLKQGKQVAKARRQAKLAPTPAGAEEYWRTHALPTDRIKPPAKTLEETEARLAEDLRKWFKEKWVRFGPDGKIRGACARGSEGEGKPKCLPQSKAHALGKKGRASAAAKKRREDPNPERRGPAKNVATKVREGIMDVVKQTFNDNVAGWPMGTSDEQFIQGWARDIKSRTGRTIPTEKLVQLYNHYAKRSPELMQTHGTTNEQGVAESNNDDWDDDADEFGMPGSEFFPDDDRLRDGDYVRDRQDGEYGEIFRMSGDPTERRVRILDRDGKGWYISPERLVAVDRNDPDIMKYFGKRRHRDMDEGAVAEGFEYGSRVQHPKYGAGQVIQVYSNGMITVNFPNYPDPIDKKPGVRSNFAPGDRDYQSLKPMVSEKQDACYRKVKSRYKVWPSAYASGALVQCRKKGAANWGNKKK